MVRQSKDFVFTGSTEMFNGGQRFFTVKLAAAFLKLMKMFLYIDGEKICEREIPEEKSLIRQLTLINIEKMHMKFLHYKGLAECETYEIVIHLKSKMT